MGKLNKQEILNEAKKRRDRIYAYITQDPPVPFNTILMMEGMHDRACRSIINEFEREHGFEYFGVASRNTTTDGLPYGLTQASARMRHGLGNALFFYVQNVGSRDLVAPKIGMNKRQQIRAETKPFSHDWTVSQIERLARELGKQPMEFIIECMRA